MRKKIIFLTLCAVLSTNIFSGMAKAETVNTEVIAVAEKEDSSVTSVNSESESTEKLLEAAIKTAKSKIQIPKEFSEFNFYFYGSNAGSNANWNLTWTNPKNYGFIEVNLDKDNNIIYYYKYDSTNVGNNIPKYLKKELVDKAIDFIRTIAPEVASRIELVKSEYGGVYNNVYIYKFQRKENGVSMPDNTVTVNVDATTGEVRSASIDWLFNVKIPSSKAKISKEEATKILGEKMNMKLTYRTNYFSIYKDGQYERVKKAYLVYEPDVSYISVDANTGEVYLTQNIWETFDSDYNGEATAKEGKADTAVGNTLTEEELAKIRELESLITKEKAIEILTSNPYLLIDENFITYNAYLNRNYNSKEGSYVWNIELRDERPVDYDKDQDTYRAYAYATVDAKTGKILSYNSSVRNYYNRSKGEWLPVEIKYDREYGKKVFEKFLTSEAKDRFNKTKLAEEHDGYVAYYNEKNEPVYGGYSYTYTRYNEGVEFRYNGIYGAVDGVTGKIYNYYSYWDEDIIFESPKGAITPEKAFEYYLNKDGYDLKYEVNVVNKYDPNYKSNDRLYESSDAYSVNYEVRLVYRPDIDPRYISPFTGEQLNYNGEVYKNVEPYHYEDIIESDENREILLLSDMNIGFEGNYFNPDKAVTEEEVNQLLEKLGYYYVKSAKESSKLITREELAYNFIKRLGFENIAKLSGIYKTEFADESSISSEYLGSVALAKGLKIFPESSDNLFNPKNNVTRREIVTLIFNFINAGKNLY